MSFVACGCNDLYNISSPCDLMCFFRASVLLLIFCVDNLSIDENRVLTSFAAIVLLSNSPFISVNIYFTYLGAPMSGLPWQCRQ